jgi:ribose 5-phosphate isomerase B
MTIYLASDHAAFELKEAIKAHLQVKGYAVEDMGAFSAEPVDWPDYGARAARKVSEDPEHAKGIIVCGSGIGMSMVSNKFKNVRAALCADVNAAEMSRKHNNANVLNMGARVLETDKALEITDTWLNTEFEGGRHQKRLDILHQQVEMKNFK